MTDHTPGITLLGLGPGDPALLTRQAWQVLQTATEVYLRTRQHPTVEGFPPSLQVHTFDEFYQRGESFEQVYENIVQQVLELGKRPQGVIYAVPGHPYVAEATCPEISRRARQEGLPVRLIEGLSFIDAAFSALELDPLPHTVILDALELAQRHVPPFPPDAPALVAQVYSREIAADVKLTLMEVYPDEHPIRLVHAAGTAQARVEDLPLYALDRSQFTGLLTTLYVPPLAPATSFESFQEVIAHLRAPDGCPWDREQTHRSLRAYLLEETYEVLAALDSGDVSSLREELGDLLLQIVLHAQIASEEGEFRLSDMLQQVNAKLVYRHPHVFGDTQVEGVEHVLVNWERLKAQEKEKNGQSHASLLSGVPLALPALVQAEQYQRRAARVGFQWPTLQPVLDKAQEELQEVRQAQSAEERLREVGDLLFAVVNLARTLEADAENALREANARFRGRFEFIEQAARQQGIAVSDLSIEQMLALWQQAKQDSALPGSAHPSSQEAA
jgi:tetrapyrrole methylase family protein/MazG family protein